MKAQAAKCARVEGFMLALKVTPAAFARKMIADRSRPGGGGWWSPTLFVRRGERKGWGTDRIELSSGKQLHLWLGRDPLVEIGLLQAAQLDATVDAFDGLFESAV